MRRLKESRVQETWIEGKIFSYALLSKFEKYLWNCPKSQGRICCVLLRVSRHSPNHSHHWRTRWPMSMKGRLLFHLLPSFEAIHPLVLPGSGCFLKAKRPLALFRGRLTFLPRLSSVFAPWRLCHLQRHLSSLPIYGSRLSSSRPRWDRHGKWTDPRPTELSWRLALSHFQLECPSQRPRPIIESKLTSLFPHSNDFSKSCLAIVSVLSLATFWSWWRIRDTHRRWVISTEWATRRQNSRSCLFQDSCSPRRSDGHVSQHKLCRCCSAYFVPVSAEDKCGRLGRERTAPNRMGTVTCSSDDFEEW